MIDLPYAVITQDLTRRFGNFTAVDRINLAIPTGIVCGFLGPNGAGKTTAMRMLCGILEPTSGSGKVLGFDIATQSELIKQHIGYMSQKFSLYDDLTVWENLNFYAGLYNLSGSTKHQRIKEMIELAQLKERQDQLVGTLSLGFKQRLALGCALISHPKLVFLDEPTSGVSPASRRAFFNIIQDLASQGTTVIVTTHFMEEAERCQQIAFFSRGKLLALASPDELKQTSLEGILLELIVPDPLGIIDDLLDLPFVKNCSIHGASLHVVVKDHASIEQLAAYTGVQPQLIVPTLDDVFIALAKRQESEVPA